MTRSSVLAAAALAAAFAAAALPAPAEAQERAKPRLLVLTFDKGDPDQRDFVQGVAEEVLINLGFPLVDSGQVRARFQLEDLERFLLLTVERDRVAELKSRFAAEAIVVVQYTRQFRYEREFLGAKHKFYRDQVIVKVIEPDTAAVVHSGNGQGDIQARTTELERLTRELVQKAGDRLLTRWKEQGEGAPRPIQVVARGFDHDNLTRLENALKTVPGVLRVDRRDFGGPAIGANNALIEVQSDVSSDELSRFLTALQSPAVKVIQSTPQRIEVALAEKLKVGFVQPQDGQLVGGRTVEAIVEVSSTVTQVTVNAVPARSVAADGRRWSATVPLQAGSTVLEAAARDDLGRDGVARITVRSDASPPTVRIIEPRGGYVGAEVVTVTLEAQDDGPGLAVTLNGQPVALQGGRGSLAVTLQDGANTLRAVARDQVGQTATDEVTLLRDTQPPVVRFVTPTGGLTNQARVRVEVDAQDNAGPVAGVTLNGRPMARIREPNGFGLELELPEGVHELVAVATDAAGLSGSAQVRLEVDVTPPSLTGDVIAVIEGQVELGSTVTYEGRAIDLDAEGRFRITVQAPAGGTITIVAVDAAGNRTERVYRIGNAAPLER